MAEKNNHRNLYLFGNPFDQIRIRFGRVLEYFSGERLDEIMKASAYTLAVIVLVVAGMLLGLAVNPNKDVESMSTVQQLNHHKTQVILLEKKIERQRQKT